MNEDAQWEKKAEILADLGTPELPKLGPPAGLVDCACRKKLLREADVVYHWTGICHARDTICRECLRMVPKHALVVCLGCRAVVARMPPQVLNSGFRIESGKVYHVDSCPNPDCKPNAVSSKIIEAELYYRENHK